MVLEQRAIQKFINRKGKPILMRSIRYRHLVLMIILLAIGYNASAQWSQGGDMVYMGELNLVRSSFTADGATRVQITPGVDENAANNTTLNGTVSDNSTINATSEDIAPVGLGALAPASGLKPSGKSILDLSSYAIDRTKSNLAGYTNIMYPISGSRGTTTSTAGGGSVGGGCGS
jgi:hypothetical protein